jgi:hypothetical protein
MQWLPIPNELPTHEVLAANFKRGSYGYKDKLIGYLYYTSTGTLSCDADTMTLENCTHYIDINKYDLQDTEAVNNNNGKYSPNDDEIQIAIQ